MIDWVTTAHSASAAARIFCDAVRCRVADTIVVRGNVDGPLAEREQRLVHGFAWIATTVEALAVTAEWAARSKAGGRFGEIDALVLRIGFGEYCAQLIGGVPMSQNEIVRPGELGLAAEAAVFASDPAVMLFLEGGNTATCRLALANLLR